MRNKEFYDYVHEWDMRLENLRGREEYQQILKNDDTKKFLENYYLRIALYSFCRWIAEGVERYEIIESLCWIFDVPDNTRLKFIISRQVKDELKAIENKARMDMYDDIVECFRKANEKKKKGIA